MSIWSNMIKMLAGETDASDTDQKALQLLDQEIRKSSTNLNQSRDQLAQLMAQSKQAEKQVEQQQAEITEHEGFARDALAQNNEPLALEIAEKLAVMNTMKDSLVDIHQGYIASVKKIQHIVQLAELDLARLKQQVATVKATESVLNAQAVISRRHQGNTTAHQALKRLKKRQAEETSQMQAELESDDSLRRKELQQKMNEAGITTGSAGANAVLNKLKNSQG